MQSKTFSVPKTLQLKHNNCVYTFDQLSQSVDYWLNYIQQTATDQPIALILGSLSFSNVAFILALIESGRQYEKVHNIPAFVQSKIQDFGAVYVSGEVYNNVDLNTNFPTLHTVHLTDTFAHGYAMANWDGRHSLDITFRESQIITEYSSGSTGVPKKILINAWLEALSIETAINYYFDPTDYCVFLHSMNHTGVHTTAILPAVFSAGTLSLASPKTWFTEIEHATHIQYFTPMRMHFSLPKKLRCLVFGGDMLKPLLTQHILDNCEVENFWDVYGLTECLPPLAVRKITKVDDLNNDFVWINTHHSPITDPDNGILLIQRIDDQLIYTGDSGRVYSVDGNTKVQMQGRKTLTVRVDGHLHSAEEFKIHLERHTGVSSHVLFWENSQAILSVHTQDQTLITQYAQQFELEAELRFQDELPTSGGIKHIR